VKVRKPNSISEKPMSLPFDKLVVVGRFFFGLALIAFGIQHFIYGDFIPGRAPAWPPAIPGQLAFAYLTGALFVLSGAAIIVDKKARAAALISGVMIFIWALLRHIPEVAANPHGIVLTNTGKALALFGGAFAVAGSLSPGEKKSGVFNRFINSQDGFIYLGRICLAAFLILCGVQHFLYAEFVAMLVPAWIPGHAFWTYFSGVALIAGGAGLLLPPTVPPAASLSGLMIFLWVLLLHVPRALSADPAQRRNEWIAVFEALAISGFALVLARRRSTMTSPQKS
jgi:uncharacterized membrane protein